MTYKDKIHNATLHFYWSAITLYFYKRVLFRSITGLSLDESMSILWLLILATILAGVFFEKYFRDNKEVFLHLSIAFGIYTCLAYQKIHPISITIALVIASISSLLCIIVIFLKNNTKKLFKSRCQRALTLTEVMFALSFACLMLISSYPFFFGSAQMRASAKAEIEEVTMTDSCDMLLQLQEDSWSNLNLKEKLNVCQTIANIERSHLGISNELNVGADNLGQDTLGGYLDATHEIIIDFDHLLNAPANDIVNTICHEAYHSYQHRQVDLYDTLDDQAKNLYMFQSTAAYAEEFTNYDNGDNDILSYYFQICEIDARCYGETRADSYFEWIDVYITCQEDEYLNR